tara:strand:+ start:343111 stop:344181 length:1071 start_codon:yes stop_codon:yes gene_type:complete
MLRTWQSTESGEAPQQSGQGYVPMDLLRAALDSIRAHVVLLDQEGTIVYVNGAWKDFARQNGYEGDSYYLGMNYLSVCPTKPGSADPVTEGFQGLMKNRAGEFRIDYPCHSPTEKRWFQMRVTCFTSAEGFFMVVVHENVTELVLAEKKQQRLLNSLEVTNAKLNKALTSTVSSLGRAIEKRDPYTDGHQKRVSALATRIAQRMDLPEETVTGIRLGALIHDIGKIQIPAELLSSPRKLSDLEMQMIRTHSEVGFEIMKEAEFPWPLAEMIHQHHERMDGKGYPAGLRGEDILLEARIIAVADVAEAISSHRPYRPGKGVEEAREELRNGRGTIYDDKVVDVCLSILEEEPEILND